MWILLILIIIVILVCFICHIKFGGYYIRTKDIYISSDRLKIIIDRGTFNSISNYGKMNSGIYVNDEKKFIIVANREFNINVNKFKTKYIDIFPTLYDVYYVNNMYYLVWEQYSDTISELLLINIPKIILTYTEEFKLYEKLLIVKENQNTTTSRSDNNKLIKDINDKWNAEFSSVTFDKYKKVIECVYDVFDKYIPLIAQQIIKLKLKTYGDMILSDDKYDNYVYKIVDDKIKIVAIDIDSNLINNRNSDIMKNFRLIKECIYAKPDIEDIKKPIQNFENDISLSNVMKYSIKSLFLADLGGLSGLEPRKFKFICHNKPIEILLGTIYSSSYNDNILNSTFKEILAYPFKYKDNIKFSHEIETIMEDYDGLDEYSIEHELYDYCQLDTLWDPIIIEGLKKLHSI